MFLMDIRKETYIHGGFGADCPACEGPSFSSINLATQQCW